MDRPLLLGKSLLHSGQMCSKPIDAISSSVVSGNLKRLWMCIDFVLGIKISIDAFLLEPTTNADIRVDALLTSSSPKAASSVYSRTPGWEGY